MRRLIPLIIFIVSLFGCKNSTSGETENLYPTTIGNWVITDSFKASWKYTSENDNPPSFSGDTVWVTSNNEVQLTLIDDASVEGGYSEEQEGFRLNLHVNHEFNDYVEYDYNAVLEYDGEIEETYANRTSYGPSGGEFEFLQGYCFRSQSEPIRDAARVGIAIYYKPKNDDGSESKLFKHYLFDIDGANRVLQHIVCSVPL